MQKFYYGTGQRGPYFEGWYVKLQATDGTVLALIPAVHVDENGSRSASLQIITKDNAWWVEYPSAVFRAEKNYFSVRLGRNLFTASSTTVCVEEPGLSLNGEVRYGPLHTLHGDIMGPFAWFGQRECAHGVISMWHTLSGQLVLNKKVLDFTGGVGYIETDRGRAFPREYVWTHCAWQDDTQNSLMVAAASVPIGPVAFTGCLCVMCIGGKTHLLASYLGATVQRWSGQKLMVRQGKYRLEARLLQGQGQALRAPQNGSMLRSVLEQPEATVQYRFWKGDTLLWRHQDKHAGWEESGVWTPQ